MSNRFPENFLWGAATSAHQVEGDNFNNNWWEWEQSGHIKPSGKACDQYHRFKEDFRIAKELGHNVHRFGIEWSRVEKDEGVWDQKEWDHYKEVVSELIKLGIEPIVTLNHFTIPIWFERQGGWLNPDSARLFSRYAAKAIEVLGEKAQYWLTINEPCVIALGGYVNKGWPPEKMTFDDVLTTLKNMLKSHVEAYREMNKTAHKIPNIKRPKISIAKAITPSHPCSRFSIQDRIVAFLRNNFYNQAFIRSAITGRASFFPFFSEKLPVKNTLDFIGLNYYTREHVHHVKPFFKNPIGEVCERRHHKDLGKKTDMGWEIYPKGIYETIKSFTRYRLPIFITENGIAADDSVRKDFIHNHLEQVIRTITEGAPIIGYLYWSLLDNFEWAEGYRPRFGLVHVDYETQKRTIRDSGRYLAEVIRTGKI